MLDPGGKSPGTKPAARGVTCAAANQRAACRAAGKGDEELREMPSGRSGLTDRLLDVQPAIDHRIGPGLVVLFVHEGLVCRDPSRNMRRAAAQSSEAG